MNRKTRDKFASGTQQADLNAGNACWETAPLIYAKLCDDFGPFDIDLTANASNHLARRWFGPGSEIEEYDALTASWTTYGKTGYSNPPYGDFLKQILAKAAAEAEAGFRSTFLLPLRMTKIFRQCVFNGPVERWLFPDKRLTFFENGVPRINEKEWREHGRVLADPALFDSTILIFGPKSVCRSDGQVTGYLRPIADEWVVPKHVLKSDLERAAEQRRERERLEGSGAGVPEATAAETLADA